MEDRHMQNWQEQRNYRKYANPDGSSTYFITVDGVDVEVSEAVYTAYSKENRRERYCAERDAGRLLSFDGMDEADGLLSYLVDRHAESAEDAAIRGLLIEQAVTALSLLSEDDQHLIRAVVMEGVTEQNYANSIGVSQVAVHKRKKRILKKISDLMVINTPFFREGK
jgi:RNA polymerase sigma factor (sigma-70 family)